MAEKYEITKEVNGGKIESLGKYDTFSEANDKVWDSIGEIVQSAECPTPTYQTSIQTLGNGNSKLTLSYEKTIIVYRIEARSGDE